MHPFDFDKEFNRRFARTERAIKRMGIVTAIFAIIQIVVYLAIAVGIIYFIVFALTHWIR